MAQIIVTATRLNQKAFEVDSPLGRSLRSAGQVLPMLLHAFFENTRPLGECYNEAIDAAKPEDILLFVHDDVWIDDWMMGWRVQEALSHFDVVGVVGNRRRQPGQETWYLTPGEMVDGAWSHNAFDSDWLSGLIFHGDPNNRSVSNYGPVPQLVQLIDGVFMAAKASTLQLAGLRFDPSLGFHFYDLDFCRCAIDKNLKIGTWPIAVTHKSGGGSVRSDGWRMARERYFEKWGG